MVVLTVRNLRQRVARLNEVAERVSRGDLSEVPKVTGNDDFDLLMVSMGRMVERIGALLDEIAAMSKEHDAGEIDRRVAEDRFEGAFRSVAEGVNGMVAGHIAVKKKAMACVKSFGNGDFDAPLEKFPGKKAFINETIEQMRANLKALILDASMLADAAVEGKLSTRADTSRHKGDFARIVQGVNDTLDAVIGPLNMAASYVDRISKGDLPAKITDNYSGEFNTIKQNLNTCIEAVGRLVEDAVGLAKAGVEGRLQTRADASKHQGDFAKIVQGVNETLDAVIGPVTEATQVLEKVAGRDLTARVQGNYAGDLGRIKTALNEAVSNLETALSQVGEASSQVAGASGQISSGSQSLAQGANEQASSLEEVSASLEEMSSMTRQNADNALAAKNLAGEADVNARTGTEAMARMSRSINKIKESSDQTAKIIKTIDEIAMQTNLLALNAAVEAARAGEAGRGFAVVAEEVRNLAQRSAQAAKNTADMIGESVKNAEEGVKISDEVSASFDKIAQSSKKVNDLIAEIAAASKKQSAGIKEVNDAVGQMDKVTQQNAANAEESASASEQLSSQAQELQGMVAQFKITGGSTGRRNVAGAHVAALPPPTIHRNSPVPKSTKLVGSNDFIPMDDDALREF
jgi:methyl-accepting chemotaxis protein